jgi:ATP-dependent protease ClpP protease subunit
MKHRVQRIFNAAVTGTTLELLVYDEIGENFWSGGGVTAQSVADAIKQAGVFDRIALRINSPGGDCFEGVAIYNLIRAQGKPVDVFVDGLAASAASTIAMSGDTVNVGVGAMIMIHNAAAFVYGDAPALLKLADTLEKVSQTVGGIYVKKTGQTPDEIKALMDAETWMGAEDAIDQGFADAIMNQDEEQSTQACALVKSFSLRGFKHVPEQLRKTSARPRADGAGKGCECNCDFCPSDDCSNCNCQGDCSATRCAAADCNCNKDAIGSRASMANGDGKTKRVDSEDLEKSAFAYQGSDKLADWKLPIKFSTGEKTESHIRNAIARWKTTDMPDAAEKDKARDRIKAAAKEHDIEIADGSLDDASSDYFETLARQRLALYERG